MSAPPSGSSGSPVPGYYPDPSIPNYIRYWNGSSWVPGTSRPAPLPQAEADGAGPAPAPADASGALPPGGGGPGSAPAGREGSGHALAGGDGQGRRPAAVDESGPVFLDEDPGAPRAQPGPAAAPAPAAAWPDVTPPSPPLPRISWGQQPAPQDPRRQAPVRPGAGAPTADTQQSPPPAGQGSGGPQGAWPPAGGPDAGNGPRGGGHDAGAASAAPQGPRPRAGVPEGASPGVPGQSVPGQGGPQAGSAALGLHGAAAEGDWAAQVRELARGEGPWRPVAEDPFAAAQAQDRPGGLVRRFAARVVDVVLLFAVTGAAAVPLGTAAYHHAKDKVDQARLTGETVKVWLLDGTTGAELGAVLAVLLVAGLLLEVLPTAKWGRTPGKKLVGLRVLDIEGQLPPGFGASLRRWLTRTLLDLTVVGVLGAAWCAVDRPWKQGVHDKAARTFVAGV